MHFITLYKLGDKEFYRGVAVCPTCRSIVKPYSRKRIRAVGLVAGQDYFDHDHDFMVFGFERKFAYRTVKLLYGEGKVAQELLELARRTYVGRRGVEDVERAIEKHLKATTG